MLTKSRILYLSSTIMYLCIFFLLMNRPVSMMKVGEVDVDWPGNGKAEDGVAPLT